MRVLITGGSGRVGSGILRQVNKIFEPWTDVDILMHEKELSPPRVDGNRQIIHKITYPHYDFALHLAAQANTPFCAKPENIKAVEEANIILTQLVCLHAHKVLMVSTNQVFDGNFAGEYREYQEPRPMNVYGETKREAEKIVLENGGAVARLDTVLGVDNRLITSIIQTIRGKDHPPFWNNAFSRPTHIDDLVQVVNKLYGYGTAAKGIFHCACLGRVFSRADFAKFTLEFFRKHNLPKAKDSIDEEECTIPFPRRLVLSASYTQKILGLEFMDSEAALEKHLGAELL